MTMKKVVNFAACSTEVSVKLRRMDKHREQYEKLLLPFRRPILEKSVPRLDI
jgi:hypothetical protein